MRPRKTYPCADCGKLTTRRRDTHQALVCLDCGDKRAAKNARQMAAREGEAWDRYIEGTARHYARLLQGRSAA